MVVVVVVVIVVIVVVVVVSGRTLTERGVYVHNLLRTDWQEPSSTHRCEALEGSKTGAQLRDDRRSAKKGVNTAEKAPPTPTTPFIAAITAKSRDLSLLPSWNVHQICDELNLGHFHCHA